MRFEFEVSLLIYYGKFVTINSRENTYQNSNNNLCDFELGLCLSVRLKIHPAYLFHLNRKDIPEFLAGLPSQPDLSTSEDIPPAPVPFDTFLPQIDLETSKFPPPAEDQPLV